MHSQAFSAKPAFQASTKDLPLSQFGNVAPALILRCHTKLQLQDPTSLGNVSVEQATFKLEMAALLKVIRPSSTKTTLYLSPKWSTTTALSAKMETSSPKRSRNQIPSTTSTIRLQSVALRVKIPRAAKFSLIFASFSCIARRAQSVSFSKSL